MNLKLIANEIFGIFENYKNKKCTYDKALEDVSKILNDYRDNKIKMF